MATLSDRTLECPGCAQRALHQRLFAKNGCDILKCVGCGLGRAVPDAFDPREYYTAEYFAGGRADGYSNYEAAAPVLRREFAHAVEFVKKFKPGGRLLEIGCAYGFFLEAARPFYDAAGLEIADVAAESCRQRGLQVATGIADADTLARFGAVDVIALFDVIEHLPDPQATLDLCAHYLNPGGIVVITTGDFSSLYARIAGRHWRLMTPPQHLWFFTPESMRRMANAVGLRLVAIDYPGKLVPLSLIVFQMRRMIGIDLVKRTGGSSVGIPVNLHDAMRCVLRKS